MLIEDFRLFRNLNELREYSLPLSLVDLEVLLDLCLEDEAAQQECVEFLRAQIKKKPKTYEKRFNFNSFEQTED